MFSIMEEIFAAGSGLKALRALRPKTKSPVQPPPLPPLTQPVDRHAAIRARFAAARAAHDEKQMQRQKAYDLAARIAVTKARGKGKESLAQAYEKAQKKRVQEIKKEISDASLMNRLRMGY